MTPPDWEFPEHQRNPGIPVWFPELLLRNCLESTGGTSKHVRFFKVLFLICWISRCVKPQAMKGTDFNLGLLWRLKIQTPKISWAAWGATLSDKTATWFGSFWTDQDSEGKTSPNVIVLSQGVPIGINSSWLVLIVNASLHKSVFDCTVPTGAGFCPTTICWEAKC